MKAWKVELNELLEKIERHTTASLWRIKIEFERSNLMFDRKFRKRFLRLTNNRLSEVYERIEIESLADNQRNIHGHFDDIRNGNQRHARDLSMEWEQNSKRKCDRSELKDERSTKKKKYSSIQSSSDVHKRLGKRVNSKNDIDDLPVQDIKEENPFRLNRIAEPIVDQSNDAKQSFSDVKVKLEVPSPTLSPCNRSTSKRKLSTDKNEDKTETACKKRKISEKYSDTNLGKEEDGASLENLTFFCVYCADTNNINESSCGTIEDVYGHWLSGHTQGMKKVNPFWFYVCGSLACFYCDFISNYQEIIKHHQHSHPNQTFVAVSPYDHKNCGLCQYVGDEMISHFETEHNELVSSKVFSPARLSARLLVTLFAIDIHKKRQCGLCDIIYETQHEMEAHHSAQHTGEMISNEFCDSQSAYVICDYCSSKVDGTKFFYHIENHRYELNCSKCDFITKNLVDLVIHEKDKHRTNALNYHCFEFGERLKKQYFNSKIVFGNGLILTNHNFKNTIYDDSKQFEIFVESLIEKAKRKCNRAMGKREIKEPKKDVSSRASSIISWSASEPSDRRSSIDSLYHVKSSSYRNPFRVLSMPLLMVELDQQNQLANNLSILGFPRLRNEDLTEMFKKLCKKLHITLSYNDVIKIYRTNGVNESVIVKFSNYETKVMVKNRAHMTNIWSDDIIKLPTNEKPTKIYVNLHTTRFYGKMISIAREARKNKSICSYNLCKRGLVVKRTEKSKERVILSTNELMDYIYGKKSGKHSVKEHSQRSSRH
ncbi:uncharacterized protein LOC116349451 [Contarinia nasturtii]|uniref:uncharacterized protein LOC116349451 n=1 Tax=Contarinia nasturtii TaxID=265458 RepID=UPI0012D43894|nr:uncharacterized protein LOC116349451 [Contarinia nasturtii]XP_031636730.1 uncharacterized protein LOC116349451 [Contarinia nasturtii]XP_031636731.1 uncharacterized protein LOC116349451 [Contarinia nasturtii]XP_031636732.1 uncharacterized protein LOC116349451 [Contarinia nasturtii]